MKNLLFFTTFLVFSLIVIQPAQAIISLPSDKEILEEKQEKVKPIRSFKDFRKQLRAYKKELLIYGNFAHAVKA